MGRPASDKRQRIVTAAVDRFHRNGYARTSLADVAEAAGLSAGNMFYYFRTKHDLAKATIDAWCDLLQGYLAGIETEPDALSRILCFVDQAQAMREMYVTLGCPLAGITRDLRQEGEAMQVEVARIYGVQFHWLERQLEDVGISRRMAKVHARDLMGRYHGAIMLAFTQSDPTILDDEVERLRSWVLSLRPQVPR